MPIVTESQTASSFLQLLTNALHDQHQIYNFISQNKTILAAPVRNGFLNNNTNITSINLTRKHNTHSPTMLGGRAKEVSNTKFSTLNRQRPNRQIEQPNQSEDCAKCQVPASSSQKAYQYNVASVYGQQPRKNATKR